MFLYILNLLNDALKKNKVSQLPAFEIINDTTYISKLAGIRKNFDFNNFSDNVIKIFELFNKYSLTLTESMGILDKLILNDRNSWILERIYGGIYIYEKDKARLDLSFIINNILRKSKLVEDAILINNFAL